MATNNYLKKISFLCFSILLSTLLVAQPSNDKCSGAIEMLVAADEGSCIAVDGDTRGTEDATMVTDAPGVCSGGWYQDDVWFSFTIGETVPAYGVTVKCYFSGTDTDIPAVGMAAYASCDVDEIEIYCFSSDDPNEDNMFLPPNCLEANQTYLVRVWSGVSGADDSGTFQICTYESPNPQQNDTDVIIWAEDFNEGLGDWTTTGLLGDEDVWRWDASGSFPTAFGGTVSIGQNFKSTCTGAVAFPAGWYQTGMTGDDSTIPAGPPYPRHSGELVSPSIDCSTYAAAAVKLTTTFRGLNGGDDSDLGALFSYSIDGGESWSDFQDASEDFIQNEAGDNVELRLGMPGAGGQSDVRLRFTFDGDFYYWIIDDIRVIEPEANNLRVNPFFATANNAKIPYSQVEPIYFLADIENIGSQMQTNANLNITITNESLGEVVHTQDLSYGDVMPDQTYENVPFPESWTPLPTPAVYTGVYTISADSTDFDASDNTQTFTFEVTENTFSKSREATGQIRPGDGNWNDGAAHSWAMGCFYHCTTDAYLASSIDVGFNNPDDLVGQSATIWLYEWDDENMDNVAQESERSRVGFNQVLFDGTQPVPYLAEVQLINFFTGDFDPIYLKEGANYLAMMEFVAPDAETNLFIQTSDQVDYSAQIFMNRPYEEDPVSGAQVGLGIGEPRYASVLGIPESGDFSQGIDYTMTTFTGAYRTALVNFNISQIIENVTFLSEKDKMTVYPNPASQSIQVRIDLQELEKEATLQILDNTGRILSSTKYENIQSDKYTVDVSSFTNGIYYMNLVTARGVKVKRFVVQQ